MHTITSLPKTVLILGATSGIGRELARIYAAEGCRVAITGRRTALLDTLKTESPNYVAATLDVTDTAQLPLELNHIADTLGHIDLFIINAGAGNQNEDLDFGIECRAIHPNVYGFTCACGWAINYFRKQGYGHLATVSSIAGLRGLRFAPAYSASKAYQISYLVAMRQKAKHEKLPIRITDIRPGFVATAMAPEQAIFTIPVEKAARCIVRAIRKKKKVSYLTPLWRGIAMAIRWMPEWAFVRI